jgi:hypothetical protein
MKLFKSNQAFRSEEDRAAGLLLENIASRYRVVRDSEEQASFEVSDPRSESTEPPE